MEFIVKFAKLIRDLIIMFLSFPVAFFTLMEDRDPLDDDYSYQG